MRLNKGMLLGFCLLLLVDYSLALFNQTGKINGGGPANGHTRIRCLEDTIGIELDNIDGWDGRLYARKMGDDPNCVKHYSDHEKKIVFDIPFNFLPCGIKSKRMIHPRSGLEYTLTVILSKDHKHMTEDDQMFTLSCRYYSNYKDVGTVMEVSTFARNYLIGGQSGPSCEYSLRYGSLNGPPAQDARIGDKVYHEWKCADSSFAFKVYDCFVHDGAEKKYKLIDEEGCSKDKTIIPDLTYDPSLNFAFAASRVFKFAESTKMFFNCLLYMCPKSDPACRQVVPPRCSGRSKRFVNPDVQTLFTVNSTVSIPQNEEKSSEEMELSANQVMDNIIPNVGWSHRLYHPSLQTNIVIVTTTPIPELPNMLSDDTGSPTMSNDNINEETTLRNDDFNVMNDGDAQLHGVVVPPSHQIERDELDNLIKQHHQLFHHDDHLQDQGRHDGQDVHHEETNDLPESLQEISHQEYITPEAMTQMIPTLSESTSAPQSCSHLKEQFKKVLIALVFGNIVSLTVSVLLLARFCAKRHSDSMSVQFRGYGV